MENYYSYYGEYPVIFSQIPNRIRLKNGMTKTNKETFTEEDLLDAGYIKVEEPPVIENTNRYFISWNQQTLSWSVLEYSYEDKKKEVDEKIKNLLNSIQWRFERLDRETALNLNPSDNIEHIKIYVLELLEIPNQEGYPYNIIWPDPIGSKADRLNGNVNYG